MADLAYLLYVEAMSTLFGPAWARRIQSGDPAIAPELILELNRRRKEARKSHLKLVQKVSIDITG